MADRSLKHKSQKLLQIVCLLNSRFDLDQIAMVITPIFFTTSSIDPKFEITSPVVELFWVKLSGSSQRGADRLLTVFA